jgi:quaternary ammonium compound-resistance protein SugE
LKPADGEGRRARRAFEVFSYDFFRSEFFRSEFFPSEFLFIAGLPCPSVTTLSREHRKEGTSMEGRGYKDVCPFPQDRSAARPLPPRRWRCRNHPAWGEDAVRAWLALFAAGLLEIAWAFGLKYSDGLTRFWPTAATAISILASFALMALALRSLPFGTAYAVWTGIGAAGSIIVGMVIFSEPADPVRLICLTLIVAGMVGLKLNSPV